MSTKRTGVTRTQKAKEIDLRRYHAAVRRLKTLCEKNNVKLFTYTDASDNMKCILSKSDYELGDTKPYCSEENENYFVTESDLIKLHELTSDEI